LKIEEIHPEQPRFKLEVTKRELEYLKHAVEQQPSQDDEVAGFGDVGQRIYDELVVALATS
jgi:hypothetical protein